MADSHHDFPKKIKRHFWLNVVKFKDSQSVKVFKLEQSSWKSHE